MTLYECTTRQLFDLTHSLAGRFLAEFLYPWQIVPHIFDIINIISTSIEIEFQEVKRGVFVHKSAKIAPTVALAPPCVVCADSEIRHGAYLRGGVLVGENCVVGNSSEIKNCILFDGVQLPHFNYAGDAVLGYRVHLGAGAIVSNVRGDRKPVSVRIGEERVETGLRKCGAFLGDGVEIGCNSVVNPGVVLAKGVRVLPLVSVRGSHPAGSIVNDGKLQ